MSRHLEAVLRHVWYAGFEAGQEEINTASWDVPRDSRFESYMEIFIDDLFDLEPNDSAAREAKGKQE